MGFKCCVPNCRSGYESKKKSNTNCIISMHSFPLNNENLLNMWCRRIPRRNFIPTVNHRVCSLHFQHSDFSIEHADTNKWRKPNGTLKRRILLKNAVPSIFPGLPSYLSVTKPVGRSEVATSSHINSKNINQARSQHIL